MRSDLGEVHGEHRRENAAGVTTAEPEASLLRARSSADDECATHAVQISGARAAARIAGVLFRLRGYTPIPLVLGSLVVAHVTARSALVGTICVLTGESLRLWGVSHAGSATRTREIGAPFLVTSGPYAYTRNPLYIGNLFMTCGFIIVANVWMPFMLAAVLGAFALQYGLIVRLEESRLDALFGETYRAYRRDVPRFGIRLTPYAYRSPRSGRLSMALISEKRTFQTTALLFVLFGLRWYWAAR
jgi:protein-S-isoprenylcysteine O-methyltransferase Ste14